MQVARIVAGYSMGKADLLRRAMGKKKKEIIDAEKEPFLEGAVKQGYSRERAGEIFDILVPFADYGFNKSHAAAYSMLSFRTAYLKANFPAEFMAANLTNEIGRADKDKLGEYIEVARKMGIPIDPPDVNRSRKNFTVVDGRIVYGLKAIKGIGDIPAEEIIRGRQDGPYKGFMDFLNRVDIRTVGRKGIELLIQTGAFDTLGQSREILLGNLERAADYAQNIKDESKYGQSSLFGDTEEKLYPDFAFEPFPEKSREEKLRLEKELMGFYLSGHPLDAYREAWERYVRLDLGTLEGSAGGPCVLIGILRGIKAITSKGGRPMAFAALTDYRGEVDLVFFEDTWLRCRDSLEEEGALAVKGKLDTKRGKPAVQVEAVLAGEKLKIPELLESFCAQPLDKYRETWRQLVKLDLGNPGSGAEDEYTLVGTISSLRTIQDKNGKAMAFGSLRDFRGDIDLVFFGKTWENCRDKIAEGKPAALKGRLDKSREKPSFKVGSMLDLDRLERKAGKMAESNTEDGTAEGAPQNPAGGSAWNGGAWGAKAPAGGGIQGGAIPAQGGAGGTNGVLDGAAQDGAPPGGNGGPAGPAREPGAEGPRWRELHIRLDRSPGRRDEDLLPLRDRLIENPGPCQVFIHVPAPEGRETVIRTASQISSSAETSSVDALRRCRGVAEVWGE
jgi:DNA polymerase-3 subunit alpha